MTDYAEPILVGPSVLGWAEHGIEVLSNIRLFCYHAHFNEEAQAAGFPAFAHVIEISPGTSAARVFDCPRDDAGTPLDDTTETETALQIDWAAVTRGIGLHFNPKLTTDLVAVIGDRRALTPKGVEVCYRLFDSGHRRYRVAKFFQMSAGAMNFRYQQWLKAGGRNRVRASFEDMP